jgi:hypothetical protein
MICLSSDPVAAHGMVSQKPTVSIVSVCATSGASTFPVAELNKRAVLSSLPVIINPGVVAWNAKHVNGPS